MTTLTAPSAGLAIAWPRWVPAAWTGFVLGALLLDVVPLAVWSASSLLTPLGAFFNSLQAGDIDLPWASTSSPQSRQPAVASNARPSTAASAA